MRKSNKDPQKFRETVSLSLGGYLAQLVPVSGASLLTNECCAQVFERKVREKKQKLADNETDLERRQNESATRYTIPLAGIVAEPVLNKIIMRLRLHFIEKSTLASAPNTGVCRYRY
jgi:hypothetical protein